MLALAAQRGKFVAARRLADEAAALPSPTSWVALQAEMLMAKAEVNRLAGERDMDAAGNCWRLLAVAGTWDGSQTAQHVPISPL